MELAPKERVNLLTGDNGLGKSFLLDVVWWALTRTWPREVNSKLTSGYRALPREIKKPASIALRVRGKTRSSSHTSLFSARAQEWAGRPGRPSSPGLVIYAHVDGGFSVWDPARNYWKSKKGAADTSPSVPAYVFSAGEVWDGLWMDVNGERTRVCRGVVEDWEIWIREGRAPAERMAKVLQTLAAPGEDIRVGPLRALSLNDARSYPTLELSYAPEPVRIVHASAGMRRIIALAYLLMWSWEQHVKSAESFGLDRATQVIVLLDEIEGHLHPRWQRSILRSLLEVVKLLHGEVGIQLFAATHSPLILASMEPHFDAERDTWYDLDLKNGQVVLQQRDFLLQGDVSNWLTSQAFDLESGRSLEAGRAIVKARELLLRRKGVTRKEALAIQKELESARLSETDPFWVRWSALLDRLEGRA